MYCGMYEGLLDLVMPKTGLLLQEYLNFGIVYEHWPETREFITRTVELWNRWIRLSCYNRE